MRVLHIITRLNVGGTASWLDLLSSSLLKEGHQVKILSGVTNSNEILATLSSECNVKYIHSLKKESSIFQDLCSFWEIRQEIKRFNPSVINTHTSKAGFLARLANFSLMRNRSRIVHTLHGHLLYGYFPKWKIWVIIGVERFLGVLTDFILVPGKRVAVEAESAGLLNKRKVINVVPGVPIPKIQMQSQNSDRPRVGWLGRLTQIKRPDRVIELARMFPDVDFFMGGDGELMNLIRKDSPTNLYLEGWVDANEFWGRVDIALLTSDNEAMPISLIEAGMLGLPAVTTNVGSTAEVVIDGKTGYVVETDIQSISEGLRKLVESNELRSQYGEYAREFTTSTFSPKNQLVSHLHAYETALGMKP